MAGTKYISPSGVARFYFHECERYLRFSSTRRGEWSAEGIPRPPFDTNPVTQAILEGGLAWEEQVVNEHLGDRVHLAPLTKNADRVRDRIHSTEETKTILEILEPGRLIYQPTLTAPDRLYEHFGIDQTIVSFSGCRPDLIQCYEGETGELRLRVIDVKASPGVKLSHRIQSTLYTIILEHVLADWGFEDRLVSGDGGVWLAQTETFETFDIRSMRPPLESFLRNELQPIMASAADEARWHLYFRCEWCEWFDHCSKEMRATNDVSRLPYLSSHAKRYLADLSPQVNTVRDFGSLLDDAQRVPVLEDVSSLRGRADRLRQQVAAIEDDEAKTYGGSSLGMPKAEHVRMILTLQSEPVSGLVYAYGFHAQGLRDFLGERTRTVVGVAEGADAETITELERELIRELYDVLESLHRFNEDRSGDWRSQKTFQAFVFDTYERKLLTGVLLRRLLDEAVAEEAMQLFFHFQRPELVEAEDHPANSVFFPVVVLIQVLRQLMALPVEVSYRFGDVVRRLQPSDFGFEYRDDDFFTFLLSNQMKSDAIFGVWRRGRADWVDSIRRELRTRLWAANSLVSGIREHVPEGTLFAWPSKFSLPARLGLRHPMLSRLAFIANYESVVTYLGIREARMAPSAERTRSGTCLTCTYEGGNRFELDPIHRDLDIEAGGWPNWILTEDSDEGARSRLSYNDYANRDRLWVPPNSPLAVAAIDEVESSVEVPNRAVALTITASRAMPPLRQGQRYLLDQRFTDWNLDRLVEELTEIDGEDEPQFARLIEQPRSYRRRIRSPAAVRGTALQLARGHGMTTSQLEGVQGNPEPHPAAGLGAAGNRQDSLPRASRPVPRRGAPTSAPPLRKSHHCVHARSDRQLFDASSSS